MCGIAGVLRLGPEPPSSATGAEDRATVDRMLRAIEYRGPDDRGIESVGRATLGAQRLAILDVAGGHQPLSDASGRVWAALNGEIYNFPELRRDLEPRHAFRTRTDTELLPHLWLERGPALASALSGMFGLAVYDARDERLLLARDPLGIKPLYVARLDGRLLWASELKALLAVPDVPRDLDLEAVGRYLKLGFVPGAATPFRAVRKLRPGTLLLVTPRGEEMRRYHEWPEFFAGPFDAATPLATLADEAERRVRAATLAMLEADVPVGLLLSGGIDSSVLAALLPEERRRGLRTFSIGFEGGGHYDERGFAREVAAHAGTRHREVTVTMDVAGELPRVAALLDEPCADPAALPAHLVARAASSEVKVLLSGTGGDEIFGGYRRHRLDRLLARIGWLPRTAARGIERLLAQWPLGRRTAAGERLVWLRKLMGARGQATFLAAYLAMFAPGPTDAFCDALAVDIDSDDDDVTTSEMLREVRMLPKGGPETGFLVDHLFYLPDDLLLKEDRMTMGASVEGRFPYLDPALVDFAAGLPLETRFEGDTGKRVLRAVARRHLPAAIARRPKHGFAAPIDEWLRGPLVGLAGETFATGGSGVFRRAALERWLAEHRAGRDRAEPLWRALSFELWWRELGGMPAARLGAMPIPVRRDSSREPDIGRPPPERPRGRDPAGEFPQSRAA